MIRIWYFWMFHNQNDFAPHLTFYMWYFFLFSHDLFFKHFNQYILLIFLLILFLLSKLFLQVFILFSSFFSLPSCITYQVSLWCSLPIWAFASSNKINTLLLIFNQKQNCTSFGNCNQIYTIDKIHIKHVSQRHEDTDGKGHAKRKQYKTYIKSKVGNKSKLSKVRRNCKKNIHGFELL